MRASLSTPKSKLLLLEYNNITMQRSNTSAAAYAMKTFGTLELVQRHHRLSVMYVN